MKLIESVVAVFKSEKVDVKVRARILQRKGTIHMRRKEYKSAVEEFESSLHESKSDAVKDLLFEAKNELQNQYNFEFKQKIRLEMVTSTLTDIIKARG